MFRKTKVLFRYIFVFLKLNTIFIEVLKELFIKKREENIKKEGK